MANMRKDMRRGESLERAITKHSKYIYDQYNYLTGGGRGIAKYFKQWGRATKLVFDNYDHFGKAALAAYSAGHRLAMREAVKARRRANVAGSCRRDCLNHLNRAYAYEGFAQHFMSDQYSSGHIRNPRILLVKQCPGTRHVKRAQMAVHDRAVRLALERGKHHQVLFSIRRLWRKAKRKFKRAKKKVKRVTKKYVKKGKRFVKKIVKKIVAGAKKFLAKANWAVCNLATALVHDKDSKHGLWVTSAAVRTPWKAYGDKRYFDKANARNARYLKKAGQTGIDEIARAYSRGRTFTSNMAAYFPRAVEGSRRYRNRRAQFIKRRGRVMFLHRGKYELLNKRHMRHVYWWCLREMGRPYVAPPTKALKKLVTPGFK